MKHHKTTNDTTQLRTVKISVKKDETNEFEVHGVHRSKSGGGELESSTVHGLLWCSSWTEERPADSDPRTLDICCQQEFVADL